MRPIIHTGKDGRIIEDLAKEELSDKLQRHIFELLDPGMIATKLGNKIDKEKA